MVTFTYIEHRDIHIYQEEKKQSTCRPFLTTTSRFLSSIKIALGVRRYLSKVAAYDVTTFTLTIDAGAIII